MPELEISFDPSSLKKFALIGVLLVVLGLELSVTMNSPIAFGDEGFHVSLARYIGVNGEYPTYLPLSGTDVDIGPYSRPPLWNLTEGSLYYIFGFSDTIVKFMIPFLSFMTGLVIYHFGRRLFSETVGIIGAIIAVTIPSFVTYSILFYTTVPYVFFFSVAFFSLLLAIKTDSKKYWVVAGLFSGLAILANISGMFMVILTVIMGVLYLFKNRNVKGLKTALKTYGVVILLIAIVITPWIARNYVLFSHPSCELQDQLFGGCVQSVAYEPVTENQFAGRTAGGGTEGSILSIGIPNYIQFAYGFNSPNQTMNLIGMAFVPFSFLAGMVLISKRKHMTDIAIIASVVIFFLIFTQVGGFFEGRSEDTARYFLNAVPLIGLVGGVYWASIRKEGNKKLNAVIIIIIFVVITSLLLSSFYNRTLQLSSVKGFVPSFFEACDWVDDNLSEDARLLSLNAHPTRYNCNRPAVWETPDKTDILLSNDVGLVKERLGVNGITHVFIQKFAISSAALGQAYPVGFVQLVATNDQTFEKVYENGPEIGSEAFNQCSSTPGCDPGNVIYRVV